MAYNGERAFRTALDIANKTNDGKFMRMTAESVWKAASKGEPWAVNIIADRYDGKPVQQINVDKEERIKLIAVVPEKSATTEDWLKLIEGKAEVVEE